MNANRSRPIRFLLNGESVSAATQPNETLLLLLRDKLHAWEVKNGCSHGDCGSCAVIINGQVRLACLVLSHQVEGAEVVTVRGLGDADHPHPLQEAFVAHGASQCGFCSPGMLITAKSLLDQNPHATREEIREALSGNLCRCTGYQKIVDAVEAVARSH